MYILLIKISLLLINILNSNDLFAKFSLNNNKINK